MKYLRKIFENNEKTIKYVGDCFLDICENPNFEVDDLVEIDSPVEIAQTLHDLETSKNLSIGDVMVLKLHIELGKKLSFSQPISSNLYIGKVKTDLEFLRMKNDKLTELYNDIEVALNRIKDVFDWKSDFIIKANRREEIDIIILIIK